MKKTRLYFYMLLISVLILSISSGCGSNTTGNTIVEPEITADYLVEDYSQQLINDGAVVMTASVTISGEEGAYNMSAVEKEVVPTTSNKKGYYIADTNVTREAPLGTDARIVCYHGENAEVSNVKDFIDNHQDGEDALYTVYFMGSTAELIVETEPEDLI